MTAVGSTPGAKAVRTQRMSIVLPGTWANIPLESERASQDAVSALVKRQVGRSDSMVRVRKEAKDRLLEVAREAREADVEQLAISLEILPGVPFPASLVAEYRAWPAEVAGLGVTVSDALTRVLPGGEPLDLESGVATRAWRQTTIRPGEADISDIKLEYYLSTPQGSDLLHVLFDVPTECDPELIVTLFDAIVDSVRWYPEKERGTVEDA